MHSAQLMVVDFQTLVAIHNSVHLLPQSVAAQPLVIALTVELVVLAVVLVGVVAFIQAVLQHLDKVTRVVLTATVTAQAVVVVLALLVSTVQQETLVMVVTVHLLILLGAWLQIQVKMFQALITMQVVVVVQATHHKPIKQAVTVAVELARAVLVQHQQQV